MPDERGANRSTTEQRTQRLRHARHLPLVHAGKERQRQRARGDVLADGELPLTVPEALAVEAHQVDRRQVGLALHAVRRERVHDAVPIDPPGQLHDEYEPAAYIAVAIETRQLQILDPRERFAVAL